VTTALARVMPPALLRWPALARAAAQGLRVQVAPGIAATVQLQVQGDHVVGFVNLPPTRVQTPYGAVMLQGATQIAMQADDFGRALQAAERAGVMPRIDQLLSGAAGGRPLLNLPYGRR
jgi:hypothetical protein